MLLTFFRQILRNIFLCLAGVDKKDKNHIDLMLSLFMTTADLSDQTKPWESTFAVSDLLYAEFFAQGDQVIFLFSPRY